MQDVVLGSTDGYALSEEYAVQQMPLFFERRSFLREMEAATSVLSGKRE
jgi:hypothetical protein